MFWQTNSKRVFKKPTYRLESLLLQLWNLFSLFVQLIF